MSTWRERRAKRKLLRKGSGSPIFKPSEVAGATGGYVSTTDPNIPGAYEGGGSGGVNAPATSNLSSIPTRSTGGGGGGSSGGGTISLPQSIGTPEQIAGTRNIPGRQGGISSTQMKVLSTGGVRVGGTKYVGQAIVPGTGGKTANIVFSETQRKAKKKGLDPGRGRFSATIPIQQEQTFEQSQQNAGQLLWGGDGVPQPLLIPISEGGSLYQQPVEVDAEAETQEKLQEIYGRQQLPLGERLQIARGEKRTLEKPINIRGGIRQFFELSSYAGEKVGIIPTGDDVFIKKGLLYKPVSTRVSEDIIISAGLLGGTTSTTAMIERQVASLTRVNIVGVSQRVADKGIITDVKFIAERAGKNVRGSGLAISEETARSNIGSLYSTIFKGRIYTQGVKFPSGKSILKPGKSFKTADITGVIQRNKFVYSRGVGSANKKIFESLGVGVTKKGVTRQVGISISEEGNIFSQSVIKSMQKPYTKDFSIKGGGKISVSRTPSSVRSLSKVQSSGYQKTITTQSSSKVLTNSIDSAVRKSVSNLLPARTTTRLIPVTNIKPITSQVTTPTSAYAGTGLYERTEGGLIPGINSLQNLNQLTTSLYTPQKNIVFQQERQGARTKSGTRQIFIQDAVAKQTPKVTQIYKQTPTQKYALSSIYAQVQIPKQTYRPFFSSRIQITPKIKPFVPVKIKQFKQPKNIFGTYKVYGRRFKEWGVIGKAKDPLGASKIGEAWAKKTLGASVYIPKFKGKIKGFRMKEEKGKIIFIEPKRQRIKRGTKEFPELSYWKGVKSPVRKTKGGKKKK